MKKIIAYILFFAPLFAPAQADFDADLLDSDGKPLSAPALADAVLKKIEKQSAEQKQKAKEFQESLQK